MIHSSTKTVIRSQKQEFSSNASQGNGQRTQQQKVESRVFETNVQNGNDQQRKRQEQNVFEMLSPSGNKQPGLAFEMQSQQGNDQQNRQRKLDGELQLPRNGHEHYQQRHEVFKQHAWSGNRQQELAFDRQPQQDNDNQRHQHRVVNEKLQEQARSGIVQQRNQLHTQARNGNQQQLQQHNEGQQTLQTQTNHGSQQQQHQHKEGHNHKTYHRHRTHHAHHSSHTHGSYNTTSRQGGTQGLMVNGNKTYDASKSRANLLDPGKSNVASSAQASKPVQEQTGSKKPSLASAIASLNVSLLAPANPNAACVSPKVSPKQERKKAPGGYPGGGFPGQPAPGGYPAGYGQPGYGAGDPLYGYFSSVAGADQQIEAVELQRCLTQSGIAGNYQMFSLETCRIMISMLDRDYSGKMGFNEFKELWNCLNQWRGTFYQYDADRSGTVEPHELHNAIRSWGYNLTPQALNIIVKRYSTDSRISFDNFIAIAVRLRLLTDSFRRRDATQTGFAQFGYDDFVQMTMYC